MKVWAIREIGKEYLLPKHSSNSIYIRRGNATAAANALNKKCNAILFEVVEGEFEWKAITDN